MYQILNAKAAQTGVEPFISLVIPTRFLDRSITTQKNKTAAFLFCTVFPCEIYPTLVKQLSSVWVWHLKESDLTNLATSMPSTNENRKKKTV